MTSGRSSDHHYSEVLEACLQQLAAGVALETLLARDPDLAPRLRADLAMAVWLQAHSHLLDPFPETLARSRRALLRQVRALKPAPQPAPAPRFGLAEFWRWLLGNRLAFQALSVLLIVVLLLGSFSGVAFAAQTSLPGERLYPVKTTLEDIRLLSTFDPVDDASLNLGFASGRVDEMTLLVAQQRTAYLYIPANRYSQQIDRVLVGLTGVANSDNLNQIQRAQHLAQALPETLAGHAAQLDGLAALTRGDDQQALLQARQSAELQQTASRQLIDTLDRQSSAIATATPTLNNPAGGSAPSSTAGFDFAGAPDIFTATATLLAYTPSPTSGVPFGPTATGTPVSGAPPAPSPTWTLLPDIEPVSASDTPRPPTFTPRPSDTLAPPTSTSQPTDTPVEEQPTKKPSNTPRPTNTHRPTPLPTNPNRP